MEDFVVQINGNTVTIHGKDIVELIWSLRWQANFSVDELDSLLERRRELAADLHCTCSKHTHVVPNFIGGVPSDTTLQRSRNALKPQCCDHLHQDTRVEMIADQSRLSSIVERKVRIVLFSVRLDHELFVVCSDLLSDRIEVAVELKASTQS